ncbi:MAG: hypothetical protein C0618_05365 [Desulfuromonas sp.]|nr:MAG: hypothetical protein C0618_05365 [Desulfuromonas sp.]
MVGDGDCVAVFHSIHRVMKAETVLKQQDAPMLLIPIPRQLTSDCGLAIRYSEQDRSCVEGILADAGIAPSEVFVKRDDEYVLLLAQQS